MSGVVDRFLLGVASLHLMWPCSALPHCSQRTAGEPGGAAFHRGGRV